MHQLLSIDWCLILLRICLAQLVCSASITHRECFGMLLPLLQVCHIYLISDSTEIFSK